MILSTKKWAQRLQGKTPETDSAVFAYDHIVVEWFG